LAVWQFSWLLSPLLAAAAAAGVMLLLLGVDGFRASMDSLAIRGVQNVTLLLIMKKNRRDSWDALFVSVGFDAG
jgi:hypothetical protein